MTVVTPTAATHPGCGRKTNIPTNKSTQRITMLQTSRASIVLRHSGRRSPDKSDKRTGAVAQPCRFLNKQSESKFPGTSEAPAHAVFGSLLVFQVNSFEESFLPSPECVHVHTHLCCWLVVA